MFWKRKNFFTDKETLNDGRLIILINKGILWGNLYVLGVEKETLKKLITNNWLKIKIIKNLSLNDITKLILKKKLLWLTIRKDIELKTKKVLKDYIVNLDDLYSYLQKTYNPGEEKIVRVYSKGKKNKDGIGFLPDGVKVIVDTGAAFVGEYISVVITGELKTPTERVVFARPKYK